MSVMFAYCKNNNENIISSNSKPLKKDVIKSEKTILLKDTLINKIESAFIGNVVKNNKEFIIKKYFNAINMTFDRHNMEDNSISNEDGKRLNVSKMFNIYNYKSLKYGNIKINLYIVKINFEDAKYESILSVIGNEESFFCDGLLLYEDLVSEENYSCFSKINSGIISVINSRKKEYKYLISENCFLNYFDDSNKKIKKDWGEKELVHTLDGLDSSYIYKYSMSGQTKNHLKEGEWEEKRYIPEYDKSVLINGKYLNGLKDGEWYYSPEGPAEKIELYKNGKFIKATYR